MTSLLINIKDDSKTEDVIRFLKDIDFLEIIEQNDVSTEKNNKNTLSDAFGIWSKKNITLDEIREKAWR